MEMLTPIVMGWVRHALTTVGGAAVAHGYVGASTEEQIVGGAMVFAGVVWSAYSKRWVLL